MLSLYMKYQSLKNRLLENEEGQGLIEYTLLLVLISVILVGSITPVAQRLVAIWQEVGTALGVS